MDWKELARQIERAQGGAPAPMGNDFESFWYRDALAESERLRLLSEATSLRPPRLTDEICTLERPCTICRGGLERMEQVYDLLREECQKAEPAPWAPRFKRGDEVEVNAPDDPNHRRGGPIWRPAAQPGEPHEVWFETGIQPYGDDQLVDQKFNRNIDHLPEVRPQGWKTTTPDPGSIIAPKSAVSFQKYEPALRQGLRRHPKPRR